MSEADDFRYNEVDPEYLQLLGCAFYNFTFLEWCAVHTIAKLSSHGFERIEKNATAGKIAIALQEVLDETDPTLSEPLRRQLDQFCKRFDQATKQRNRLLHAKPSTGPRGEQRVGAQPGHVWSEEEVFNVAKLFEDSAIFGNEIFHGQLAKERSIESLLRTLKAHESVPEWSVSEPREVGYFPETSLTFVLENYIGDDRPEDFAEAVRRFLSMMVEDRELATPYVYENYSEVLEVVGPEQIGPLIEDAGSVWDLVNPKEVVVSRHWRDERLFIQILCGCSWEPEHGLQIVYRNGDQLSRVSAQDGHLTYSDAYGLPDGEDRIGG